MIKTNSRVHEERRLEIIADQTLRMKKRRPIFKFRRCQVYKNYFKNVKMWRLYVLDKYFNASPHPYEWYEGHYEYLCMNCKPTMREAWEYWRETNGFRNPHW